MIEEVCIIQKHEHTFTLASWLGEVETDKFDGEEQINIHVTH